LDIKYYKVLKNRCLGHNLDPLKGNLTYDVETKPTLTILSPSKIKIGPKSLKKAFLVSTDPYGNTHWFFKTAKQRPKKSLLNLNY